MKKIFTGFIMMIVLFVGAGQCAGASSGKTVFTTDSDIFTISGKTYNLTSAPVMDNNRFYVPLRDLVISQNGNISWDAVNEKATVSMEVDSRRYTFTLSPGDSKVQLMNAPGSGLAAQFVLKKEINLGEPCMVLNDRLYVPLRPLAEGIGYQVQWLASTNSVEIN